MASRKRKTTQKPQKKGSKPASHRFRVRGRFVSRETYEAAVKLQKANAKDYEREAYNRRKKSEEKARDTLRKALGMRKRREGEKAVSPEILERKRRQQRKRAAESYSRKSNGYEITVFHTYGYFDDSKAEVVEWIGQNTKRGDVVDVSVYTGRGSNAFGTKANTPENTLADLTGNDPRFNHPSQNRPGTVFWLRKETKAHWSVTRIRKLKTTKGRKKK